MQWKQYCQYQMDFNSRWTQASAALMGVSFFARMVYYFGVRNIVDCGFLEIIISMILPLVLTGAFLVLVSTVKHNVPELYALIGCCLCGLLLIEGFFTGSIVRILLSILFYGACGAVLLITVAGYFPGKLLSSVLLAAVPVGRFLFFGLGKLHILAWVLEISVLLMLFSLYFFTLSIKKVAKRS